MSHFSGRDWKAKPQPTGPHLEQVVTAGATQHTTHISDWEREASDTEVAAATSAKTVLRIRLLVGVHLWCKQLPKGRDVGGLVALASSRRNELLRQGSSTVVRSQICHAQAVVVDGKAVLALLSVRSGKLQA